jgi:hypothetical protein
MIIYLIYFNYFYLILYTQFFWEHNKWTGWSWISPQSKLFCRTKNAPLLCASLSPCQWPPILQYLQTHTNASTNCGKKGPHQPSPNNGVPLTTTAVKTHMQYLHLRNTLQFAHRPEYPLSEYHCRMASSLSSFPKGSMFNLRPEMEYCERKRS